MVFNSGGAIYWLILIINFFWLLGLSFFLYRIIGYYSRLTKGSSGENLKAVLEKILAKTELSEEKLDKLTGQYRELEEKSGFYIKKIGVSRFNPFKDTGGNQSFVIALLDDHNNGLVLSSLYARTGNRWYVKRVQKGKGTEHELSKEEEGAIKKAQG